MYKSKSIYFRCVENLQMSKIIDFKKIFKFIKY